MGLLTPSKKKSKTQKITKDEIKSLIDQESVESIYPFVFELNREYIASSGNYIKPYVILTYPTEPTGNWLSPLKKLKGNITISQFLEPANGEVLNSYYNETIKNKEAELLRTVNYQMQQIIIREIKTAKQQLEQSLDEKSAYVYLYTYILLQGTSEAELKALEENLNRILLKLHVKAITPYRRIDEAFWSTLPIQQNSLKEYTYYMTNSMSASSFFPYDDNEICDITSTSTLEGINKETDSWISIDYKNKRKTLNRGKVVIGTSGVGKTTYMWSILLKKLALGEDQIYIIDPENEYSEKVRKYGGTVIDLSSVSSTIINPYQVFSSVLDDEENNHSIHENLSEVEVENLIKQRIQRLKGFHKVLKPDMNQEEISIISSESKKLYDTFRSVKNLNKMENTDWPILEDLYNRLSEMKSHDPSKFKRVESYYYILEDFVHGSSTLFNGHTNIELNTKVVSFNLKPLQTEKDVQSAAYLNTFSYLWEIITADKTQSCELFCDEFHFLLLNEESADFFFQAYKRFRKYNAGATVTTQQIEDVLNAPKNMGAAIIGNSFTKVFFGLEGREVDVLKEKLKLPFSEKEIGFLKRQTQGEALISYGSQRAFLKVVLTEEEKRILNPEEYERTTGKDARIQPDWSSKVFLTQNEIFEIEDLIDKEVRLKR